MATVSEISVRAGRRSELALMGMAWVIIVLARALVDYNAAYLELDAIAFYGLGAAVLMIAAHFVLDRVAPNADPVMLPAVFTLNGVGIAEIHRIDLAEGTGFATAQITWAALGVATMIAVLLLLRDHRKLRRYTYTAGVVGLILYMLPLVPGLGITINGARIWISALGYSMQPGEFAKIALVVFFAGYLVTNRDTLALAGPKFLGLRFPRPRDMGPLLLVWAAAMLIMVYERDLGASLLFFGIFLGMLYVATQRLSWVLTGMGLFAVGGTMAALTIPHVRSRFDAWLHALDADTYSSGTSEQLVRGLFGMASGGLFGTGLGEGRPDLVPYAESDFIIASLGEELGLTGLMAILTLYLIIVQRAFRASIGVRDGFGKLLASGLGFAMAIQVFIVVGGVTRVIPLTGLTAPFLAYGGSSLLANWIVIALLLRVSDMARRPSEEVA
ncbi:FtsW/RodA/SpoVE family cell cycle protein [Demequina sp. B12]|uniref:FtsW/RodA/SpoVE family cell cycle protein n=1 Tax=Demequina sp. B12 TaxID=2992757 RepID=UPI00237B4C86|nr:FtsW/RodA/SpoVE family cell cycle protein [Demequina sp. B12]MDE0572087.1 FtsW/RodA/SpoVE family cell cycle protein [Demequina sp. B12]